MKDLHFKIAKIINKIIEKNNFPDCEIILDKACHGTQNIPLFCSDVKSNPTEYCNVDILILKKGKIKVLIEIEVSKIIPTQICGKFLTSALSISYIHKKKANNVIEMDDSVFFIQIVDIENLKTNSRKFKQFENLKNSINAIIPLKNSKIKEYFLLQFEDKSSRKYSFINSINKILSDRLS